MAKNAKTAAFDPKVFLATVNGGRSISKYRMNQKVFSQGTPADAVFYIQKGKVKVTVVSEQGKEAVVAVLGPDEFCGEGCLNGQPVRLATATAMAECEIMRLEKAAMIRVLHEWPAFSEMFVSHLLARTLRVEADLVDQLFNSSEKRLARALLLLANFGKEGEPRTNPGENQPRDTCRDDRHDAISRQCFHEQISRIGSYRLQRPHRSPSFVAECGSARATAHQQLSKGKSA